MMSRSTATVMVVGLAAFGPALAPAWAQDDAPFAEEIEAFTAADAEAPPERGGILFVGSSSIRMWDLPRWFPDLDALNRGFGGSQFSDAIHYADQIILPYGPRLIVLYEGDNDIASEKTPAQVFADFESLLAIIREELPQTPLIYIPIKPSLARWHLIGNIRAANDLIAAKIEADETLHWAPIVEPMLGDDGAPREELFLDDGLHLNDKGYELWSGIVGDMIKALDPAGTK